MEKHHSKIPRHLEPRLPIKTNKTLQDMKTVRFHIPQKPPPSLKKSVSLLNFGLKYKDLTPEQYDVKYKKHPHIVYKRCCIICGMRRPHPKTICTTIKKGLEKCTSNIFTQTKPPTPPPERWNAETQTKRQEAGATVSQQRCTQTDEEESKESGRSRLTCGLWLSVIFVLLCIAISIGYKYFDVLNHIVYKDIRQPKSTMQKLIYYFSSKGAEETSVRSSANMLVPSISQVLLSIWFYFLFKSNAENMF